MLRTKVPLSLGTPKQYAWRNGVRFSGQQKAQEAGNCITRLGNSRKGMLTPRVVVTAAKAKRSPLHGFFTWNNSEAAQKCRLDEAKYLLRAIVVILPGPDHERMPIVVTTTQIGDRKPGVYVATEIALSDPVFREKVLGRAARELEIFAEKYKRFTELARVTKAIRLFLSTLPPHKVKKKAKKMRKKSVKKK